MKKAKNRHKINEFYKRFMGLLELYDSQVELGDESGLTPATISAIKQKKIRNPSYKLLTALIEGVQCNAQWLMVGEGNAFDEDHPDIYKIKNRAKSRDVFDLLFPNEGPVEGHVINMKHLFEEGKLSQDEFVGMLENLHGMIGSWISHYRSR